ncbi:hypothetical protein MBANPS3_007570 [Mucor bainieri]
MMTHEEDAENMENVKKMNMEHNTKQEVDAKENRLQERQKPLQSIAFPVARLFVHQLVEDMKQLKKNKQANLKGRHALGFNLSMAAKWAP